MVDTHSLLTTNAPAELVLDPFSFHAGMASRIKGLGGDGPGDESYAFHTPYVDVAPGMAHFTLVFGGLKARNGTLQLRVYMLPTDPGGHARISNSDRVKLNWIAHHGMAQIKFEAFRRVRFALHGLISDETDAEAQSLVVLLDRPWDAANDGAESEEVHSSAFGRDKVEPTARLVSLRKPEFSTPVSQMATTGQFQTAAFSEAVQAMGISAEDALLQWQQAYLLKALECYGMLERGVRALAFNSSQPSATAFFSRSGLEITLAEIAAEPGANARPAGPAESEGITTGSCNKIVNPGQLPGDLLNYDVLWSENIPAGCHSVRDQFAFVETTMRCLRPGGLAIHLLPYDPTAEIPVPEADRTLLGRHDIERLCLILISRGYEVAQVNIHGEEPLLSPEESLVGTTSFGLIVRRPRSVL